MKPKAKEEPLQIEAITWKLSTAKVRDYLYF
jgi:hypothetical protein